MYMDKSVRSLEFAHKGKFKKYNCNVIVQNWYVLFFVLSYFITFRFSYFA